MRPLLGTYVEIAASGDAPTAQAAIEAAYAAIERAQRRWSFHDPASELSTLNARPGRAVPVSRDTLRLLAFSRALTRASDGRFDCTLGGALVRAGRLPDHGGPAPLDRGEASDIELGRGWARLRRPVRLTLDGIAKGRAIDLAIGALRRGGVSAGWVNAGGDLRVFGDLTLPVQQRGADGVLRPLGGLRDAAMASSRSGASGEADRFPGWLLGRDGRPPAPGVWTVLARSACRADALTKVAATAGDDDERQALLHRLGGVGVVPSANDVHGPAGQEPRR